MIAEAPHRTAADPRARNEEILAADLRSRNPRPDSLPPVVRFETTTGCTLGCRHCFKRFDTAPVRVMPLDLWDRLAAELFPSIRWLALAFDGEPLQDPLLDERLRRIGAGGPRVDLLTSGDGLLERTDRLLPVLGRLTISLEALRERPYAFIRPGQDLAGVLRAVERFDRLRARSGPSRCVLAFRVTVFEGNHDWLSELVRRLAAAGADEVRFAHGVAFEGGGEDLAPPRSQDRLAVALQRAAAQGGIEGVRVYYPALRPGGTHSSPEAGVFDAAGWLPDHAPWTRATIDVDGSVSLCCPKRRLPSAASVLMDREKGFRAAWTSVPFQVVRAGRGRAPCCASCPDATEAARG